MARPELCPLNRRPHKGMKFWSLLGACGSLLAGRRTGNGLRFGVDFLENSLWNSALSGAALVGDSLRRILKP